MKKTFIVFSLLLSGICQNALADNRNYLSFGAQGGAWELQGYDFQGLGWVLDGGIPISDSLALVGAYSKISYDADRSGVSDADLTEWQLGARWKTDLPTSSSFGLQYRYVGMNLETDASSADETGHRGQIDLDIGLSDSGRNKRPALLNLSAGQTAYDSEDRWFVEVGMRSFLDNNFSLGLHYRNEADDRHLITLSIREDR